MKISLIVKQRKRINSLENKVETLENVIKNNLYKEFMKKLGESSENDRLKRENRNLRKKNKILKDIIKENV